MSSARGSLALVGSLLLLAGVSLSVGSPARAQDSDSYRIGEHEATVPSRADTGNGQPSSAPRLARFDYVSGNITWRLDDRASWTKAAGNQSLRQGAQIWVSEGGRAEIRFDDGSLLRLGNGAVVTLQTLYRDDQGDFTLIKISSGLATLRLRREHSIYQVDTPVVSVKADGPARVRVGVADRVEVGVRLGHAVIDGKQGKITLDSGDFLALRDAETPYTRRTLPSEDSWECWNDERDRLLVAAVHPVHRPGYGPSTFVHIFLDVPLGSHDRRHWWH